MAIEKSRAVVLRSVAFGETSAVVTLYCRDLGKVRALAKGAWRPKSGFDGGLDLLSTSQVLVLRRTSGGLDLLTEACLETRFRVGASLPAVVGGMHVAELLDGLTGDADPHPELFDAAHATLRRLSGTSADDATVAAVVVAAELAILRLTGHAPALGGCAACRATVPAAGRTPFGMLDGGLLCGRCRAGRRSVISVSAPALAALRGLAIACPPAAGARLEPPAGGEVRAVMDAYLTHTLERPLVTSRGLSPRTAARSRRAGS
ncbi:MAG: DNA repair protein RecO [Planctomycetaceae bacterium]